MGRSAHTCLILARFGSTRCAAILDARKDQSAAVGTCVQCPVLVPSEARMITGLAKCITSSIESIPGTESKTFLLKLRLTKEKVLSHTCTQVLTLCKSTGLAGRQASCRTATGRLNAVSGVCGSSYVIDSHQPCHSAAHLFLQPPLAIPYLHYYYYKCPQT